MTPGAKLTNQIREAASKIGARLFVQSSGAFWQGRIVSQTDDTLVLKYPRRVTVGFEGLSDLLGGTPITVTPEMVGQTIMVLTAIEVKAGNDQPRPKQPEFIAAIKKLGGRAGFARSIPDAIKICNGE